VSSLSGGGGFLSALAGGAAWAMDRTEGLPSSLALISEEPQLALRRPSCCCCFRPAVVSQACGGGGVKDRWIGVREAALADEHLVLVAVQQLRCRQHLLERQQRPVLSHGSLAQAVRQSSITGHIEWHIKEVTQRPRM
jgi:hypothetical protein